MSTRVFKSTTPSSVFPISVGTPDPSAYSSFTGVSTSYQVYTGLCKDLSLKVSATADWTGAYQWEESDSDPSQPGVTPHWALIPGTSQKASLLAAAGDDIQVPTKRCMFIRFNLITQTGGGPLNPSVEGWGAENRPIL